MPYSCHCGFRHFYSRVQSTNPLVWCFLAALTWIGLNVGSFVPLSWSLPVNNMGGRSLSPSLDPLDANWLSPSYSLGTHTARPPFGITIGYSHRSLLLLLDRDARFPLRCWVLALLCIVHPWILSQVLNVLVDRSLHLCIKNKHSIDHRDNNVR
jgi:hypothetical protein